MPANKGYTLMEVLVSIIASTTLLLGFLSVVDQFNVWAANLNLLLERDENFWLAPLLLTRWIAPAGNNRWTQTWDGFSTDPVELRVKADIDGSTGFPDAQLTSSFEEISLRHQGLDLQLKSGSGSFQPALKNISLFQIDDRNTALVRVRISSTTERPLLRFRQPISQTSRVVIFLWNYRPNLFAEAR